MGKTIKLNNDVMLDASSIKFEAPTFSKTANPVPLMHLGNINDLDSLDGKATRSMVYTCLNNNYLVLGYLNYYGGGYSAQIIFEYFGAIRYRTQQAGVWGQWANIQIS